jgi:hypothetical protein
VQSAGCRVQDAGCRVQGVGCRVPGLVRGYSNLEVGVLNHASAVSLLHGVADVEEPVCEHERLVQLPRLLACLTRGCSVRDPVLVLQGYLAHNTLDPAVGLCLGTYGDPRGGGSFS